MQLRFEVFFKDFGFEISVTPDELEPVSRHFSIIKNNEVIAYGRLSRLPKSDDYRLSQIVVRADHRSTGLSLKILQKLIDEARQQHAKKLILSAQKTAQGLYEKFGFRSVDKPYLVKLTGVEHQKMELRL
jgi:predicted GNAT family N-acyltransferase